MCISTIWTICKASLADELAREFDDLLQPRRLSLDDPIERIAAGCGAFINQALHDPAWGALIARGAAAMPDIARVARGRLNEDIRRAAATGRLHDVAPDLAFEFVLGITVRTMQSAAEGAAQAQARARHRRRHSARDRRHSRGSSATLHSAS